MYTEAVTKATQNICSLTGTQPGTVAAELIADEVQEAVERELGIFEETEE